MNFYIYKAVLLRVVDADSIDVRVDLGFSIFTDMKLRLLGINAPEMNTAEGKAAKLALETLLPLQSPLIIETYKDRREKYGRFLATLLFNDMNVNTWLVENGYAVPYML